MSNENFTIKVDEVSDSLTYVGRAARNSATDKPVWQLMKVTETGTITDVQWAEGRDDFKFTWDDRTSYSYS